MPVHVFQTFTYKLPPDLQEMAQTGARIIVPLGRRRVSGYIVGLSDSSALADEEIKEAFEILDSVPAITPELLELTRWVADYYAAPWGEVIKSALPPGISAALKLFFSLRPEAMETASLSDPISEAGEALLSVLADGAKELGVIRNSLGPAQAAKGIAELERFNLLARAYRPAGRTVKEKQVRMVRFASEPDFKATAAQQRVIDALRNAEVLSLRELLTTAQVASSTVSLLAKRKVVEIFEQSVRRDPFAGENFLPADEYQLTAAQTSVLEQIQEPLRQSTYAAFLLHGVTGSGKTEVYMRAMRLALELGKSALMLVPEIALTPVFSRRLRSHFGEKVAIFHSSLSPGERFDEWSRVRSGEASVVIGTRSGVFAPLENLGVVVIDEEHESSYRQQESPQYHGRDTAIVRAQKAGAVVILGSATPSLESFHNAQTGKYSYLQLPQRIGNRPMAAARLIDMRNVFEQHKKPQVFADELLTAIEETMRRGEQSIILLNRRGYSSFVLCRSCGERVQCPNCDVTLTYHRSERVIVCHYCNHREAAPSLCPNCHGKYIYYIGEGTEQIEESLRKIFPQLRLARIDRDTTARRKVFEKSLTEFSEGRLDMLVGTQMLAKGHDYPNVTLVGVVSVDAGLALPDFRAAERTFQLLTQVAGRAGRGDSPGRVLIQTYYPEHYALRHACAQDYLGFYNEEIRHRQNLSYPPFVSLASLIVHGPDLQKTMKDAVKLRSELDRVNAERSCRILGPAPAPLSRLKGEHRVQLLIKSRSRRRLREVADQALSAVIQQGVNARSINLEIDPISIM